MRGIRVLAILLVPFILAWIGWAALAHYHFGTVYPNIWRFLLGWSLLTVFSPALIVGLLLGVWFGRPSVGQGTASSFREASAPSGEVPAGSQEAGAASGETAPPRQQNAADWAEALRASRKTCPARGCFLATGVACALLGGFLYVLIWLAGIRWGECYIVVSLVQKQPGVVALLWFLGLGLAGGLSGLLGAVWGNS